jgi:ABC-type transport system substrate-binding protein/class 3 adenylate cyclase
MAAPAGERRIVSILLVDIVDSTAIGEQLGAERSKVVFDEVIRLIAREIKRFGGTVAQLTGDGLYALFGVPTAHEDDAERAVRAGQAVHHALGGYARALGEAYGIELQARIGINTGPVVVLGGEAPADERYNALGDTVNVAARLQTHAGRGGVVLGPVTARHVEHAFDLEPLGALELKGKAYRVEGFRLTGERAEAGGGVSPLVGREAEMKVLDAVLDDLAAGRGAIVAITGEPGIGKSRLAAEARARWSEQVRFLGMQGVSYAQDVPYYPLRELLRGFVGLGVADPEARVRLELRAGLATSLGDRGTAYYPFLASLLGLALEDDVQERLRNLASDSVQRQTHEAVVELARALSDEQPLCLVLEDLHFADEPTLQLAEELLSLADEEAVAVLLLYRSDPDLPSWHLGEAARRRYLHRFRELQLDPLAPEEGAQLAATAAGGELTAALAAELAERTGGNPLFVEEAARDAVERGDGAAVPVAIQETLQARLDRLAPETREVASVASVVGRTFGTPLLERLVSPERLRPALSELQRLDLVVEERRRPTPEYRFRHGLVQEAAYTSLLDDRRRELHRIVGAALEELHEGELSEAYGLLARHFAEADEPEKAARYLIEAGDAAHAVYAEEEAIAHYRRALLFLDRLGDEGRARRVLFKIALEHHLAFDFEAANAAWAEAFARPAPAPLRSELTERIAMAWGEISGWVPGRDYHVMAWLFGPNLFRGLLRIEQLDVVPDLAESVAVSDDGCTYELRLRDRLHWSDGKPLSADDFAFTYRAMRELRVASAHFLDGVDAEAIDARSLRLSLDQPRAHFPFLLAQFAFFPWPRHRVEALGDAWTAPDVLVGNGPFVLHEFGDERSVLKANAQWQGTRGNVEEVLIERMATPRAALDAWAEGRFDILLPASDEVNEAAAALDTVLRSIALPSTEYLAFPDRPPFDDWRLRTALAHGLDRQPFVRGATYEPALGGFLPPAIPGHSHDLAPVHDPPRARQLLAEAGYPDGRGLPELRLLHADFGFDPEFRREVESRWERQWCDIGIRLRQEWRPESELRFGADSFWTWGWSPDYPDPEGTLTAFLNAQPVARDDELMRLIEDARSLRSRDERLQRYREADRYLVTEQAWVVPTVYSHRVLVHRPWVEGMWTSPTAIATLDELVVRR